MQASNTTRRATPQGDSGEPHHKGSKHHTTKDNSHGKAHKRRDTGPHDAHAHLARAQALLASVTTFPSPPP